MVVQGILQDLLGELVHLPKQELKLDLLNGHVLLGNLDVQPKALQVLLGLPLVVQAGMIGRVELHIPWSKLGTEPTRVLLDRVLLLVSPQSAAQLGSHEEKAATERKLVRLREHKERSWAGASAAAPSEPLPSGRGSRFFSSLAGKLVKNLQVRKTSVVGVLMHLARRQSDATAPSPPPRGSPRQSRVRPCDRRGRTHPPSPRLTCRTWSYAIPTVPMGYAHTRSPSPSTPFAYASMSTATCRPRVPAARAVPFRPRSRRDGPAATHWAVSCPVPI